MSSPVRRPPFSLPFPCSRYLPSEYPWWQPFKNDTTLETQYQYLLRETGCKDLTCLRSIDTGKLGNATQKIYVDAYMAGEYGYGDYFFGPAVDGKYIQVRCSLD